MDQKQVEHAQRVMASRVINDALGCPIEYGQEVSATLRSEDVRFINTLRASNSAAHMITTLIMFHRSIEAARRVTEACSAFTRSRDVAVLEAETNRRRIDIAQQLKAAEFDTTDQRQWPLLSHGLKIYRAPEESEES